MHRVAVGMLVVLVAATALVSVGCVDEAKYNSVLLANREQKKLLDEKEAQVAVLNERVAAITARGGDAQRLLAEKDDHLAAVSKERDELRRAFTQLMDAYKILSERPVAVNATGIPEKVAIEIRQLAQQYPGVFEFDEATGRLRFVADLTFDSGSNVVKPDAKSALTKLGGILVADIAKGLKVAIVGHTDTDPVKKPQTIALLKELGKATSNQGLSEARAESVAEVLKAAGVEPIRLSTKGVGESQPIADNKTPDGKAKNRRVEIFLSAS
jgi:outer membrane protein OmpA-like peptidoglycan-associated protein